MILRLVKRGIYAGLNACSISRAVSNTRWRGRRLLILCYHGIALSDEHRWKPTLFMRREMFESRMEFLRRNHYTILPLADALVRLYSGDLPPHSVVLTFDDGGYDFYAVAAPILARFGYPATVYLTTYYCDDNRPVFRLWCSYLLWKRGGVVLESALATALGVGSTLDLRTESSRESILRRVDFLAHQDSYTASDKDDFSKQLADVLEVETNEMIRSRLLHIMNPSEVTELAARGIDFQLHTHRHRLPADQGLFVREIEDNRARIRNMTHKDPVHFCYPSGEFRSDVLPWLKAVGVESATTCDPGIAGPGSNPLLLPRFVDTSMQTQIEFQAWLSGCGPLLPRRTVWQARAAVL